MCLVQCSASCAFISPRCHCSGGILTLLCSRKATTATSSEEVLRSERIAGGILYKTLNTFDLVAIFIAIVLFITNSPGIAAAGPVSYIYLVVGFLTFLIPGAIITGHLGKMFPQEGSIYVWTN